MGRSSSTNKKEVYDQPQSLLKTTLILLKLETRTNEQIAIESGLPYFWIQSLSQSKCTNPSVNRVQILYEFLSQSALMEA